jgi:hypothetical protein
MTRPKGIKLEQVNSSAVRGIAYDSRRRKLYVAYRSECRQLYAYSGVTRAEWRMLHEAPSIGRFVNTTIKRYHDFVRIDTPDK